MSRALAAKAIAAIIVFGVVASVFLSRDNRPDFSDFKVYWVAGGKAAEHRTVYDVQGHYQFKYSPFVASLWALPVAVLPGSKFHWAWLHYAGSAVGWYAVWFALARWFYPRRAFALWLALVLVFCVGLRDELKLGQANLWPFALVLPAWFVPARNRNERGFDALGFVVGLAWGLAVQWKLYALVLAPVWLLRRRLHVGTGAIAVTALTLGPVLGLAHGWQFALEENTRWLRSLTASSEQLLISQYNVSALGIFGKWTAATGGPLPSAAFAFWGLLAIAWCGGLWWAEREASRVTYPAAERGSRPASQPALLFWSASWAWAGVVVLNPLVWPYWLLLLAPLFAAYVSEALAGGGRADLRFWLVCALFAAMNWAQNYPVVHYGGSLLAVLLLLADAWARAHARDAQQLARLAQMRVVSPRSALDGERGALPQAPV